MSGYPSLTVTQLNRYIKEGMDSDDVLAGLFVRGEISNFKTYPSGHSYFSLKDAESSLRCVMFRREAAGLRFRPENGMQVIAFGRVSVYLRDGQYQLNCMRLTPDGVGDLYVAFEQLKAKLQREGLFDPAHKRPIPPYPERIVLVTSPAGAAVRDMLRILKARWPAAQVILIPVRVQGAEAPGELCAAIRYASENRLGDLIITGRGGGSMEDLWAFNNEYLAREIYSSSIPVISAVGHEPDVTIADLAADLRAATPSNGAELAVPDREEAAVSLHHLYSRLEKAMVGKLDREQKALERFAAHRIFREPGELLRDRQMYVDRAQERLTHAMSDTIARRRAELGRSAAAVQALSPLNVLQRGYTLAERDGKPLTSAGQAQIGEQIRVRFTDGALLCRVEERKLSNGKKTDEI